MLLPLLYLWLVESKHLEFVDHSASCRALSCPAWMHQGGGIPRRACRGPARGTAVDRHGVIASGTKRSSNSAPYISIPYICTHPAPHAGCGESCSNLGAGPRFLWYLPKLSRMPNEVVEHEVNVLFPHPSWSPKTTRRVFFFYCFAQRACPPLSRLGACHSAVERLAALSSRCWDRALRFYRRVCASGGLLMLQEPLLALRFSMESSIESSLAISTCLCCSSATLFRC